MDRTNGLGGTKRNGRNPFCKSKLHGYCKKKATFFTKGVQGFTRKRHVSSTHNHMEVTRPCERYSNEYFVALVKQTDSNDFIVYQEPMALRAMPLYYIHGAHIITWKWQGLVKDTVVNTLMLWSNKRILMTLVYQEPMALRAGPLYYIHGAMLTMEYMTQKIGASSRCYNVSEDNIVVEKSRLLNLINECSKPHQNINTCEELNWDLVDFEPWGLFSSVVLRCTSYGFCSPRTKLYEEVNTKGPGRKAAVGNVRLQLLLQDMPTGPTELQLIFAAVGLRAGSLPGVQKLSYKASLATEVADTDMIKWREHTKKVLADWGVNNPDEICAAFDVRCHGMFKASSKTPGPGATQATATCVNSDATEEMYS